MQFYSQTGGYNNFWQDVVKSSWGRLRALIFPSISPATKTAFQTTALTFWRTDEKKKRQNTTDTTVNAIRSWLWL